MKVAVDASVLVGLINPRDHRRLQAMECNYLPTAHQLSLFVIASRRRRRSNPPIGQEIASLRSQ